MGGEKVDFALCNIPPKCLTTLKRKKSRIFQGSNRVNERNIGCLFLVFVLSKGGLSMFSFRKEKQQRKRAQKSEGN